MYLRSLVLLCLFAVPAQAQDGWADGLFHRRHYRPVQPRYYYAPPVQWREPGCRPEEVHSTSALADSESGALFSARQNWGAKVRAEIGEHFMDHQIAAQARHRCFRASTNETLLGKGAEALGAFQWRCEYRARPCKPEWQEEIRERR